ncbi:MAG: hypothetical protein ACJ8G3_27230 [Burkholderiaceae bacterium]
MAAPSSQPVFMHGGMRQQQRSTGPVPGWVSEFGDPMQTMLAQD